MQCDRGRVCGGGCGFGVESSFHSSFGAQIETISDPGRSTIHVYCPNVLYGVLFLARSNTSQIQDTMHS